MTYFTHRITNATAEGINSKIQTIKLMACGYRNRDQVKSLRRCKNPHGVGHRC